MFTVVYYFFSVDSDFELNEWNAEDEKTQEDGILEKEKDENKDIQSNEESNSVADSDTNHEQLKSVPRSNHPNRNTLFPDERTIDLFPSDNSNQTANRTFDEDPSDNDSVDSAEGIKLRLDSLEDTQDCLANDETSGFTKLKIPDDHQEQSSDASNMPNTQPGKSGMNKSSENLDRSGSNDGLTPFSRIQRLLGVDCSPSVREV